MKIITNKEGLQNLINDEGVIVSKNFFDYIDTDFRDGWAVVAKETAKESKSNYMDENGNLLLKKWVSGCMPFENGTAVVTRGHKVNIVNKEGKFLLPKYVTDIWKIYSDAAIVYTKEKNEKVYSYKKMFFVK